MNSANATGVAPLAEASPSSSAVEHWGYQVNSPFRGPAEIRELAARPGSAAVDEALGEGLGESWSEAEDPFLETYQQSEDFEDFEGFEEAETEGFDAAEFESAVSEADLLEEMPASAHPLAAVFSLPRLVFDALAKGASATAIALAIGSGIRDVNKLTNLVFWFRHPSLIGQKLRPDQRDLAREWIEIRDGIVKPVLAGTSSSVPSPRSGPSAPLTPSSPTPATPTGGSGRTSIPSDGLRWYGPGQATPELMAFMRRVYDLHVQRSKGPFVDTLPRDAIEEIEPNTGKYARKDAARKAREMLAAARDSLRAQGLAGKVRIGVLSGYRSADQQFDIWQGKSGKGKKGFPKYYADTKGARGTRNPHGEEAAKILADYLADWVAAPGYSNHQDGLALDLGVGAVGGSLGKLSKAKPSRPSWFWSWLKARAGEFDFKEYPKEAWHWVYRPGGSSSTETWEAESAWPSLELETSTATSEAWPSAETWELQESSTAVKAGRLEVQRIPLLASHRGRAPDLVLGWNDMAAVPTEIDVVVHLHGYSWATMSLPKHIEVWAGLDLAPVDGASGSGRTRPTLTVLPRGHFTGVQSGKIYRYTFPALTTRDGLTTLVQTALKEFAGRVGGQPPRVGRLILMAHSGGGSPLMQILRRHDPHEVHVFDGLYQDASALADWAIRRINADRASAQAGAQPVGAMRVFFRPGTRGFSVRLHKAIAASLDGAPTAVAGRYRVEASTLGHWQIPRQYGWRILADAATDVPDAKRLGIGTTAARRMFEFDSGVAEELEDFDTEQGEAWELEDAYAEAEADDLDGRFETSEADSEFEGLDVETELGEPPSWTEFEEPEAVDHEAEFRANSASEALGAMDALDGFELDALALSPSQSLQEDVETGELETNELATNGPASAWTERLADGPELAQPDEGPSSQESRGPLLTEAEALEVGLRDGERAVGLAETIRGVIPEGEDGQASSTSTRYLVKHPFWPDFIWRPVLVNIDLAVRQNRLYAKSLGWGKTRAEVIKLILGAIGWTAFTSEPAFAMGVAQWQARQGLGVDGQIGPRTWSRIRALLCKAYDIGEESRSQSSGGLLTNDVTYFKGRLLIADFKINSGELRESTRRDKLLNDWVDRFEKNPAYRVIVMGFTDCVGSEAGNETLRQRRAATVANLLGPSTRKRVDFVGSGDIRRSVTHNLDPVHRALNRSVLIEFKRDFTFPPETVTAKAPSIDDLVANCRRIVSQQKRIGIDLGVTETKRIDCWLQKLRDPAVDDRYVPIAKWEAGDVFLRKRVEPAFFEQWFVSRLRDDLRRLHPSQGDRLILADLQQLDDQIAVGITKAFRLELPLGGGSSISPGNVQIHDWISKNGRDSRSIYSCYK